MALGAACAPRVLDGGGSRLGDGRKCANGLQVAGSLPRGGTIRLGRSPLETAANAPSDPRKNGAASRATSSAPDDQPRDRRSHLSATSQAPGELLHLDTKKLARIRRIGHRIHGDRSKRVYGAGWEFAHVCIDDHTRLAYVEVLPDERGATAAGFLRRALAWYRKRGIEVERVMTDNGACYISREFGEVCEGREIRHLFTKPYTPKTNGKAERFIQTLTQKWAYRRLYRSSSLRASALRPWIQHYNHDRPH